MTQKTEIIEKIKPKATSFRRLIKLIKLIQANQKKKEDIQQ